VAERGQFNLLTVHGGAYENYEHSKRNGPLANARQSIVSKAQFKWRFRRQMSEITGETRKWREQNRNRILDLDKRIRLLNLFI